MKSKGLPEPYKEAMIYEDSKLYACLANFPIVKGHTVVVWKEEIRDLHLLSREDYEYLMDKVETIRDALLKAMNTDKVYLFYMDEVHHVHWHLVPRTSSETGFTLLEHKPQELKDFSLADELKKYLSKSLV